MPIDFIGIPGESYNINFIFNETPQAKKKGVANSPVGKAHVKKLPRYQSSVRQCSVLLKNKAFISMKLREEPVF